MEVEDLLDEHSGATPPWRSMTELIQAASAGARAR